MADNMVGTKSRIEYLEEMAVELSKNTYEFVCDASGGEAYLEYEDRDDTYLRAMENIGDYLGDDGRISGKELSFVRDTISRTLWELFPVFDADGTNSLLIPDEENI